jgi:hypothetical protein
MNMIRAAFLVSMLAALGGCMVVPVNPGPPAYYAPASGYYGGPAYYGPSIGIGLGMYGGGRGYRQH